MIKDITGIILAGGKSSRMGRDKPLMLFEAKPLIEIAIGILRPLCASLMIVTNKPDLYQKYGIKTETDVVKERGPLAGIYSGLLASQTRYNFVLACDMPLMRRDFIRYLLVDIADYDAVVPQFRGRLEPLCAVYSKNCAEFIKKELSRNNLKVTDFLKYVKVKTITEEEIIRFDIQGSFFANINTPQNLQEAKKI